MILKQFYLNWLAHALYLVGDPETGTAAVVDPQRDVDGYLAFAAEHRLRIAHVFLTHFHADFLAGPGAPRPHGRDYISSGVYCPDQDRPRRSTPPRTRARRGPRGCRGR